MSTLTFSINIRAPKAHVWQVMLADSTYREWTSAFHAGSHYVGSWDEGAEIRFLAEDDGKLSGMVSKIIKNTPYDFISIEHMGEVIDGKDDLTSDDAQQWAGSHENYTFSENSGITTVKVDLEGENIHADMSEMFEGMWPPALAKLKEIAERL